MAQENTYFLGRVIKLGSLTNAGLVEALKDPVLVRRGDFVFTFTDIVASDDEQVPRYIFARLTKFTPEGAIAVVEPDRHVATQADVTNLLVASSPFIYLPAYSGIAYPNVWNKLEKTQFERAFVMLVEEKFSRLFVQAAIEPVADLVTFVQRVASLDAVEEIDATVHPPNPLFGRAWASLRDYIQGRELGQLRVSERASGRTSIRTRLLALASSVIMAQGGPELRGPEVSLAQDFGDAAVLMAADGYGKARVIGMRGSRRISVRTSESQVSFGFDRDPNPAALYEAAERVFSRISAERYMEHP